MLQFISLDMLYISIQDISQRFFNDEEWNFIVHLETFLGKLCIVTGFAGEIVILFHSIGENVLDFQLSLYSLPLFLSCRRKVAR